MKSATPLARLLARFDAISVRERMLTALAVLGGLLALWDRALMQPLSAKRTALSQELVTMQENAAAAVTEMESDPVNIARAEETRLRTALQTADAKIGAISAGLLPPRRMIDVIHDVLKRSPGVELVSLKNKQVRPLVPPAEGQPESGPYVHPVELVVEGSYLDVLAYLRQLETLPWQLHWQTLELDVIKYPRNRVRIELNTISMEKEWLGV